MKLFLLVAGVFWVIMGTLMVFTTGFVKDKFFSKFKKMDLKKWSVMPIVVGVLFLVTASASRARVFIVALGVLSLAKGFYMLLGPKEKVKKHLHLALGLSDNAYKVWGVVILILGVLVLINY